MRNERTDIRKKHDILEFLNSEENKTSAYRFPSPRARMKPNCSHDCYCKTRVPIAVQRSEISAERAEEKAQTGNDKRASKKSADEESKETRSSVTSSSSAILSPGTSNALENAERIARDAQLQIMEIGSVLRTSCIRSGKRHLNIKAYKDDPPLEDENDQLLYIRERVVSKFWEADNASEEEYDAFQSSLEKREIQDISVTKKVSNSPKIKLNSRRLELLPKNVEKALDLEKLSATEVETYVKGSRNDAKFMFGKCRRSGDKLANFVELDDKTRKMNTFCVQNPPPLIIERELQMQKLDDIHISPDPSFVQKNSNIATYEFVHKASNACLVRREKFIKILEEESNTNPDTVVTKHKRSRININPKQIIKVCSDDNIIQKDENVETLRKEQCESLFIKKKGENALHKEEDKIDIVTQKQRSEPGTKNGNITIQHVKGKLTNDATSLPETREDVDKIRQTEEQALKNTKVKKININIENTPTMNGTEDLIEFEEFMNSTDERDDMSEAQYIRPSSSEQNKNTVHDELFADKINKKEKQNPVKHEKDDHLNAINQRFMNILTTQSRRVKLDCGPDFSNSFSKNSVDSENLGEISLYHPSFDQLDDVLSIYKEAIENVVRNTKSIDKFLSRSEFTEYCSSENNLSVHSNLHMSLKSNNSVKRSNLRKFMKNSSEDYEGQVQTQRTSSQKEQLLSTAKNQYTRKKGRKIRAHSLSKVRDLFRMKESQNTFQKEVKELDRNSSEDEKIIDKKIIAKFSGGSQSLKQTDNNSAVTVTDPQLQDELYSIENSKVDVIPQKISENIPPVSKIHNFSHLIDNVISDQGYTKHSDNCLSKVNFDCTTLYDFMRPENFRHILTSVKDSSIKENLKLQILQNENQNIFLENIQAFQQKSSPIQQLPVGIIKNENKINEENSKNMIVEDETLYNEGKKFQALQNIENTSILNSKSEEKHFDVEHEKTSEQLSENEVNKNGSIINDNKLSNNRSSKVINKSNHLQEKADLVDESLAEISNIKSDQDSSKTLPKEESKTSALLELTDESKKSQNSVKSVNALNKQIVNDNVISEKSESTKINLKSEKSLQKISPVIETKNVADAICKNEKTGEVFEKTQSENCSIHTAPDHNLPFIEKCESAVHTISERNENLSNMHTAKNNVEEKTRQYIDKVVQISSSDSLQNCVSLQTLDSSKNNSKKQLYDTQNPETSLLCEAKTFRESNTLKDVLNFQTKTTILNALNASCIQENTQKVLYTEAVLRDSVSKKYENSSSSRDEVPKIFCSTFTSGNFVPLENNFRSLSSSSKTDSNKTETLSEGSHSEGELCLTSSCSYSLGEIRIQKSAN